MCGGFSTHKVSYNRLEGCLLLCSSERIEKICIVLLVCKKWKFNCLNFLRSPAPGISLEFLKMSVSVPETPEGIFEKYFKQYKIKLLYLNAHEPMVCQGVQCPFVNWGLASYSRPKFYSPVNSPILKSLIQVSRTEFASWTK